MFRRLNLISKRALTWNHLGLISSRSVGVSWDDIYLMPPNQPMEVSLRCSKGFHKYRYFHLFSNCCDAGWNPENRWSFFQKESPIKNHFQISLWDFRSECFAVGHSSVAGKKHLGFSFSFIGRFRQQSRTKPLMSRYTNVGLVQSWQIRMFRWFRTINFQRPI